MNRLLSAAVAVGVLLAATGCADAVGDVTGAKPKLEKSYDKCIEDAKDRNATDDTFDADPADKNLRLEDGGHTVIGDGLDGGDITTLACIFIQLDTPQSVVAAMDSTTAMMGRQKDEAGGYKYEWSYHPDNGLNIIITD